MGFEIFEKLKFIDRNKWDGKKWRIEEKRIRNIGARVESKRNDGKCLSWQ